MRVFGNALVILGMVSGSLNAQVSPNNGSALRSDEYAAVALIYNDEVSALGRRALFPICILLPASVSEKPLLKYLQGSGYAASDSSLCNPAMATDGQHHPIKDYPHGLLISLGAPQRDQNGLINLQVQADDLTLRPGEHFATMLRKGIYHLRLDDREEWQIVGYTKDYDSADDDHQSCGNAKTTTRSRPE